MLFAHAMPGTGWQISSRLAFSARCKGARWCCRAIGRKHMDMRIEGHQSEALGGPTSVTRGAGQTGRTQPRWRNSADLIEALKSALSCEAMSVTEATKKVIEAGYQSNSPSFRLIVNQTLAKRDQLERVGRALYKSK